MELPYHVTPTFAGHSLAVEACAVSEDMPGGRARTGTAQILYMPPHGDQVLQVFGKSESASGPACPAKVQGLAGLIGNTPLVRIASLSEATGCEVSAATHFAVTL